MKGNREEKGETVEDKSVVNEHDAQTNIDTDVITIDTDVVNGSAAHDAQTNIDTDLVTIDADVITIDCLFFSITVITYIYIGTILAILHTAVAHRTLNDPLQSYSDFRFAPPFPVIDSSTTRSFLLLFPF